MNNAISLVLSVGLLLSAIFAGHATADDAGRAAAFVWTLDATDPSARGVIFLRREACCCVFSIGSGRYTFSAGPP